MIRSDKILEYIYSDIGLCDLTTMLEADDIDLSKPSLLRIYTREDIVFSGEHFVKQIAKNLECEVLFLGKNADRFKKSGEICVLKGSYENIHKAWKLAQVLLEYSCKISTYTNDMLNLIKQANPKCVLAATRKSFPFAKQLCVDAVLAGGGTMHRLGLYDSVLFFKNHIIAYPSFDDFCSKIYKFKAKMPEKKIMVECESVDEFKKLLNSGVDVIQCDKFSTVQLTECLGLRDSLCLNLVVTISGGVNLKNCHDFAKTGVDGIITSAPYMQGVSDLGAKIEIV